MINLLIVWRLLAFGKRKGSFHLFIVIWANDDARTEEVLLFLNLNSLTTSTSTHCTVHATFTTLTLSVTINLSTHFTILFDPFLSLPSRFHFHHLHFGMIHHSLAFIFLLLLHSLLTVDCCFFCLCKRRTVC